MDKNAKNPLWLNRHKLAHPDHHRDLELRAAANEFYHRLPRHEAEKKAYDDYLKDQLVDAAAHHLSGMKAAHAAGDVETAKKHGLMYGLVLNRLDPKANVTGEPPPEVTTRSKSTPYQVKFKAHPGDTFALPTDLVGNL